MEDIATLISTMGFPIVCCLFMWKYINTTMKDFTSAMNENTKMLSKLCQHLEEMKLKINEHQ